MTDIIVRFFIGGLVVSLFSLISDLLKPKTFAGLFGAAPSVALATLALTVMKEGKQYAAIEGTVHDSGSNRVFLRMPLAVSYVLLRFRRPALPVALVLLMLLDGRGHWALVCDGELTAMIVTISTSGLKRSKWWEFLLRFVLGGLVTAGAGLIAKKFGPSFGGLFLAFPAILASSVTLVEKHERERKQAKRHEWSDSRPSSGRR